MTGLARSIYLESRIGALTCLEPTGALLENPHIYDKVAKELKVLAGDGLLQIISEQVRQRFSDALIDRISFARLR